MTEADKKSISSDGQNRIEEEKQGTLPQELELLGAQTKTESPREYNRTNKNPEESNLQNVQNVNLHDNTQREKNVVHNHQETSNQLTKTSYHRLTHTFNKSFHEESESFRPLITQNNQKPDINNSQNVYHYITNATNVNSNFYLNSENFGDIITSVSPTFSTLNLNSSYCNAQKLPEHNSRTENSPLRQFEYANHQPDDNIYQLPVAHLTSNGTILSLLDHSQALGTGSSNLVLLNDYFAGPSTLESYQTFREMPDLDSNEFPVTSLELEFPAISNNETLFSTSQLVNQTTSTDGGTRFYQQEELFQSPSNTMSQFHLDSGSSSSQHFVNEVCPTYNLLMLCKDNKDREKSSNYQNFGQQRRKTNNPRKSSCGRQSDQLCYNCQTAATTLWRRDKEGNTVCNACGLYYNLHKRNRPISMKKDTVQKRNRKPRSRPIQKSGRTPSMNINENDYSEGNMQEFSSNKESETYNTSKPIVVASNVDIYQASSTQNNITTTIEPISSFSIDSKQETGSAPISERDLHSPMVPSSITLTSQMGVLSALDPPNNYTFGQSVASAIQTCGQEIVDYQGVILHCKRTDGLSGGMDIF
ncbi:uncharacterized protein LOC143238050 [Tachypleus tridentatus]|uniref:uncharacterized protein LOC143238050 n=1 Tax=Tachypleus tridentatus TaxID=6853 RepID=UPI003FCF60C7